MKYKFLLIIFIVFVLLFNPRVVSAITIKDYRDDLAALEKKKADAEKNKAKTEAEINAAKEQIRKISNDMISATNEQKSLEKEITSLNEKIEVKNEEIKELISFYQVSGSENFYLKYLFGAESFTDFIYRFSVIEQLTKRSDELVDEMNSLIEDNNAKVKSLDQKKKELESLEEQVKVKMSKLDDRRDDYAEEGASYDEQIAALKKQIAYFKSEGCGETENLSYCINKPPADSSYINPLKHGWVSEDYGPRTNPCSVCSAFHKGMDIGVAEGTSIYSPAAGIVRDLGWQACGGRTLTINHIVNGRYVTTRYMHLLSYSVKKGDIVKKGQKIAETGGGWRAHDSCTTGAHLHFETVEGHYFGTGPQSYTLYSTYLTNTFDPRKVIWFPAEGASW